MSEQKKDMTSVMLYKRLLRYAAPYWPMFVVAIFCTIVYSSLSAGITYLIKPMLDKGFVAKDIHYIRWIPVLFIGIFLVRGVANFFANYCMSFVGKSVVMILRQQIFNKLLRLPTDYYDSTTSGALLSSILYNTSQVSTACTSAVAMSIQNVFYALGLIGVMFFISWQLTLIVLVAAPIFIVLMRATSRRQRGGNKQIQDIMGEVTHVAEEVIEGYKVVKTFGAQEYEQKKFQAITEKGRSREMKVVIMQGINTPLVQLVGATAMAIMLFLATSEVVKMNVTAGGFAAMFAALLSLLTPLRIITRVNAIIQQGLAGAEAIFGLLDQEDEKDTGTLNMGRAKGEVAFKHVNFHYKTNPQLVLRDLNFTVRPGESIALVGRSGAGKSSLASLLTRFHDTTEGDISIDGVSIYDLRLEALRDQIAVVSQHVTLFNDTIAHNIAYGRLHNATIEDVEQAAIAAHAMEFIKDLPDGLQTQIGEHGLMLSGGQRQRLAIARAILKDAPILILDEATSALDTESERYIQAALDVVMRNRTTFIIAHRLSTIEKVDRIIVMDKGQVIEMGDHRTLLSQDGMYTKLHRLQFSTMMTEPDNA